MPKIIQHIYIPHHFLLYTSFSLSTHTMSLVAILASLLFLTSTILLALIALFLVLIWLATHDKTTETRPVRISANNPVVIRVTQETTTSWGDIEGWQTADEGDPAWNTSWGEPRTPWEENPNDFSQDWREAWAAVEGRLPEPPALEPYGPLDADSTPIRYEPPSHSHSPSLLPIVLRRNPSPQPQPQPAMPQKAAPLHLQILRRRRTAQKPLDS